MRCPLWCRGVLRGVDNTLPVAETCGSNTSASIALPSPGAVTTCGPEGDVPCFCLFVDVNDMGCITGVLSTVHGRLVTPKRRHANRAQRHNAWEVRGLRTLGTPPRWQPNHTTLHDTTGALARTRWASVGGCDNRRVSRPRLWVTPRRDDSPGDGTS